jgi:hypothetical protein
MPAIFHTLDDTLVEVLPKYPDSMEMSGRYSIDFPDHFDLKLTTTPTLSNVTEKISKLMSEKFISFDYFITNDLRTNADFEDNFETNANLQISLVDNQFLPVHPSSNPEYTFKNSFKRGSIPNTTSVYGRFPQQNHINGSAITSDKALSGNRCLISKNIDISGSTSNGLGRNDFFIYFRSALKAYTKDSSLSDVDRGVVSPVTANQAGSLAYTNTQYDSTNRLRCFISSDGSNYSEIENLKVFSFNQKVDSIKIVFVNYTDADLTLLSYTLMY